MEGGQERPQRGITVTQDREPMASASRMSPLGAEQEGVLWELRARIKGINGDSGSPLTTHPHSRYPGPWGEEGNVGNARNQSVLRRNTSEESDREGMLGTGEEGEPGGLEGGRRSIDSTHRREPGGQNGEEIIPELKMRIARLSGELPELSEQKEEATETPISQGTPPETPPTAERKWPYWMGLLVFISLFVSAVIYLTVHFTQEDSK
ncbi:uncharacterized protein [Chiloscyllium punctatum]|uniref:uncharacterized protein n=1 Tax=Chiloscyllium punctatum TaxID=137246 RepID=UPI003B63E6CA